MGLCVRLACLRHAASVHPEPGSNSQINQVNPKLLKLTFLLSFQRSFAAQPVAVNNISNLLLIVNNKFNFFYFFLLLCFALTAIIRSSFSVYNTQKKNARKNCNFFKFFYFIVFSNIFLRFFT